MKNHRPIAVLEVVRERAVGARFLRHQPSSPRPWQVPLRPVEDAARPPATLHVVLPTPTQFADPLSGPTDHRFSLGTDHGVLVVHAIEAAGVQDQPPSGAPGHADVRVREDIHVPEDLDPSTAVVSCHDGQLDIRIPMGATTGTGRSPQTAGPT